MPFSEYVCRSVPGSAILIVLLLAGCGHARQDATSQSIARVNGEEITIHQLNELMERANVGPELREQAGRQLAKLLVDRQVLVQEAIKTNLERRPGVMQALQDARAQILAQAYLQDRTSSVAKPTAAEVTHYFNSHPELFGERKTHVLDQLVFVFDGDSSGLAALSDQARKLEEVSAWLDAQHISYTRTQTTYRPEGTPPELQERLGHMRVGDLIFLSRNGRSVVGLLTEVRPEPVTEHDARQVIERTLMRQKQAAAADAEIARLHRLASVEYLDQRFRPESGTGQPQQAAPHVEKGVAGL